ncbi:MAG TPA: hydantoinase B/oxoprolinase family protein [Solirubrobacterales bacterium]|jgi:N-methylhydantoinase B|nr:hydantoinase B/oxoprolinase family protein [Solirubrobacterales bacterium]
MSEMTTARQVEEEFGIDLVTAETIRSGLIEVTRHMHRTLSRGGFSNVVRELFDFAVCVHLLGDEGTEMVSVTEGCTHFAFTQPHMANFIVDEWGMDNFGPGDTIVCNDPWRGSIHLPDVNLFRPVFWEGEPFFMLSDASHLLDIGGPVPGGFNNEAEDFFSEGLRIPPTLITSADKPVRSTINLILENSRTPLQNLGDLRALFGTMKVGETRLLRLLQIFGPEAVAAASRYTLDLAERRMRRAIERIEDGVYDAEEWVDDDGVGEDPVRLALSGRVAGSHVELDFSGSDAQPLGSLTTCWEETVRVLIGAKMTLDPNHPMNSGAMRPFHVLAPPGSVVMGTPPTSNSQHAELATKIAPLSQLLFGQMVPEHAVGADGGTSSGYVFGGIDQRPGREGLPFGGVICLGLGWGGTSSQDGISFCPSPIWGITSPTIELMERDIPVIFRSMNAQIDSAGAGRFRAGYANTLLLEPTEGSLFVTMNLDSGRFPRRAAQNGGDGMTSYIFRVEIGEDGRIPQSQGVIPMDLLKPVAGCFDEAGLPDPEGEWARGTEFHTTKLNNLPLGKGDVLLVVPAGGGGYGDPLERDPADVRLDVWNEKLSLAAAAEIYGVVLGRASLEVDVDATHELRTTLAARREAGGPGPRASGIRNWPRTIEDLAALSITTRPSGSSVAVLS